MRRPIQWCRAATARARRARTALHSGRNGHNALHSRRFETPIARYPPTRHSASKRPARASREGGRDVHLATRPGLSDCLCNRGGRSSDRGRVIARGYRVPLIWCLGGAVVRRLLSAGLDGDPVIVGDAARPLGYGPTTPFTVTIPQKAVPLRPAWDHRNVTVYKPGAS
jgi:hypothetical protein